MNNAENMREIADETWDDDLSSPKSLDSSMETTRMAYIADLLLELQGMASAEGHATLAGLLALAHSEAVTKTR